MMPVVLVLCLSKWLTWFLICEKAVASPHRALKTRGNTPKYGLIFHSTFIGRAAAKNKGRISRYLANKCTIASRIDCFSGGWTRCIALVSCHANGATAVMLSFFVNSIHPRGWCWDSVFWAAIRVLFRKSNPALSPPITLFFVDASEVPTSVFGDKLRGQVEERLSFYETGEVPRKNVDVMKEAVKEVSLVFRGM